MTPTLVQNSTLMNLSVSMIHNTRNSSAPDTVPLAARTTLGTLLSIGVVIGILGNILVLSAILLDKVLRRQAGNFMIFNLAVTDLLMACLPMSVLGAYFTIQWPKWNFGETMCKLTGYLLNICGMVSVLTMVLIAFDRYFAIVRNETMLERRNVKIVLCLFWLVSAVALIYPVTSGGISKERLEHGESVVCNRMDSKVIDASSYKNSLTFKLMIGFFTIVALLLIYARLGVFLWRNRNGPSGQAMRVNNTSRQTRALKLVFAIVLTYFICWFPYQVATFLRIYPIPSDTLYIDPIFMLTAYSLAMLNSSINPVVYALVSQRFRMAYRGIIRRAGKRLSLVRKDDADTDRGDGTPMTRVKFMANVS